MQHAGLDLDIEATLRQVGLGHFLTFLIEHVYNSHIDLIRRFN
jgi:hypothetical protein